MTQHHASRPGIICVALVLLATVAARADSYYLDYDGRGLRQNVTIHYTGLSGGGLTLSAGQNLFTYRGNSLTTYCVDLFHYLDSAWVTEEPVSMLDNGPRDDGTAAAFLYFLSHDITTSAEAAAVQAAIWEVIYEDDDKGYDLLHGDFYLSNTSQDVLDEAQDLLDMLDGDLTIPADTYVLHSSHKQDMLYQVATTTPQGETPEVPDPATMILVPLGAMAVGAYTRRRRRKGRAAAA